MKIDAKNKNNARSKSKKDGDFWTIYWLTRLLQCVYK